MYDSFPCVQVMILMSGWMPNPDVAVATMGVTINTSGERLAWLLQHAMLLCMLDPLDRAGCLRMATFIPSAIDGQCRLTAPACHPAGIIWMWVTGYAMALSTRVSNSLGAGCPRVARRATWVAVSIALALVRGRQGEQPLS